MYVIHTLASIRLEVLLGLGFFSAKPLLNIFTPGKNIKSGLALEKLGTKKTSSPIEGIYI